MNASELLVAARAMVQQPRPTTTGLWSRAAALLGRQALEAALDNLWLLGRSGIESASMRTQLLCLPSFLGDEELAGRVAHSWSALTRACHQHPYELAPTAQELERWLDVTQHLLVAVERRSAGSPRQQV
jgi:hypothetical protein